MLNNDLSFFENSSAEFNYFISNMTLELLEKDLEYKKKDTENRLIFSKYPKIIDLLEGNEIDGLNKKECKAMMEYLDNELLLKYKQLEEMFFRGYKEAYFYFKKCNLLKDNDDKR